MLNLSVCGWVAQRERESQPAFRTAATAACLSANKWVRTSGIALLTILIQSYVSGESAESSLNTPHIDSSYMNVCMLTSHIVSYVMYVCHCKRTCSNSCLVHLNTIETLRAIIMSIQIHARTHWLTHDNKLSYMPPTLLYIATVRTVQTHFPPLAHRNTRKPCDVCVEQCSRSIV